MFIEEHKIFKGIVKWCFLAESIFFSSEDKLRSEICFKGKGSYTNLTILMNMFQILNLDTFGVCFRSLILVLKIQTEKDYIDVKDRRIEKILSS